jgi:hypothetical protein
MFNQDLPESVRGGQQLTGMTASQTRFPVAPSFYKFAQHGQAGRWCSELFPYTAKVSDELCVIKSLHTEAINHEPAILSITTGNMFPGKPSVGAWLSYGLGAINDELPTFVVMISKMPIQVNVQALSNRLWSSGFLSPEHAAVALRSGSNPVLHLKDPPGVDRSVRRAMIDGVNDLNHQLFDRVGDPEINARISQYEMAFRMQTSVPELTIRTISMEGTKEMISSAICDSISVGAPKLLPLIAVVWIASTTFGCAWPKIIGPQEPIKSMYLLPSISKR